MRKSFLILVFILFAKLGFAEFALPPQIAPLLQTTGVECELTLPKVVEATQKAWKLPYGKERWEVEETFDLKTRTEIVRLCSEMGFFVSSGTSES